MEPPPLPRRAFLVATTEIPPFTELTWSYGVHYPRPWLSRPPPSARGKRVREVNSDDDSPKPPSLPKFQKCNKWNKTAGWIGCSRRLGHSGPCSTTVAGRRPRALSAKVQEGEAGADPEKGCFCGTDRHLPSSGLVFAGFWVHCELCGRWCHGECAGMTQHQADAVRWPDGKWYGGVVGAPPKNEALLMEGALYIEYDDGATCYDTLQGWPWRRERDAAAASRSQLGSQVSSGEVPRSAPRYDYDRDGPRPCKRCIRFGRGSKSAEACKGHHGNSRRRDEATAEDVPIYEHPRSDALMYAAMNLSL
ncbi:hypothetical protein EMIHUDRAFT_216152 [Emiliania huxleyi CCMP1516]|uniref:Uncharacterized protein n=2 Tax=Emiliania huxleyi TaxID=2903 RepID=A0A0D3IFI0_EMIH1|nr:hypothetical protein EMIHUDRAFT_216152 [Emiliania huxleyi CCMP1516]EOD10015.1 hypothetical protein EMIHUDRAFT_216152 [Emiliania huxleyi CCMP1516]|eukprot:XP_005762444.1 hypothetical protein EMIHUDRAFT_216152 [Emiliania huxleyi CCMP1516]